MLTIYSRPYLSIGIASTASSSVSSATTVHVSTASISATTAATSTASSAAASITLLESSKLSPLFHHPLSLRDLIHHQPCDACSGSIGQSFVLYLHRGTLHQVGFIPLHVPWWVVGAFPSVVVYTIPAAEVWTIF